MKSAILCLHQRLDKWVKNSFLGLLEMLKLLGHLTRSVSNAIWRIPRISHWRWIALLGEMLRANTGG